MHFLLEYEETTLVVPDNPNYSENLHVSSHTEIKLLRVEVSPICLAT